MRIPAIRVGLVKDVGPEQFVFVFVEDQSGDSVVTLSEPISEEDFRGFLTQYGLLPSDVERLVAEARSKRL